MDIKYNLTEEDYLKFNMYHMKNSKTFTRTLNMQRFLTPIIFIILSYVFSIVGNTSFLGMFIVFLIASILWIIFYPKFFYKYVIRNTKKMIKEGNNDGLFGERHLIMTEDGIRNSTSFSESRVDWSGIKSLKEDNYYFYLYVSSVSAYIIPKRELRNIKEIKNYIRSKIPHNEIQVEI